MSLPDTDHVSLGAGRPQERPLITTSVVIYATLGLLALTVPRGLVNWSRNFEPDAAQRLLQNSADAIQSLSRQLALDWPYVRGREIFLRLTGKSEE